MWTKIVYHKIRSQAALLRKRGNPRHEKLTRYLDNIEFADATNREGHAAKVYFNALFGKDFSRGRDNAVNAALDYGYSLILSSVNKEVVSCGYLTQLGICHRNEYNYFNLSCDIMEPFRVIVDEVVAENMPEVFDKDMKYSLLNIFNKKFVSGGGEYYFSSAISIYTQNILKALTRSNIDMAEFFDVV